MKSRIVLNKKIKKLEEDRLDAIEESDFEKADKVNSVIKNMRKEKMKKGVKLGLGITAIGVVIGMGIVGYECLEYYILGGDLL